MLLDDDYATQITQRFERRPVWTRPSIHLIATARERESQRLWLNEVLGAMPDPTAAKVLSRMEAEENFLATYNELAVAGLLLRTGRELDYEPDLGGRTPDLVVHTTTDQPAVLVEISTKFRRPDQLAADQRWKELKQRVERIGVPLGLYVRGADLGTPEPPDSGTAKRVARELAEYLSAGAPLPFGSGVQLGDYLFCAAAPAPGSHVILATPASTGAYDADLVLEAINAKISRYARTAEELGASIVVVLAAETQSPLTLDLLRTTLRGSQALTMTLDLFGPGPVSSRPLQMRARDEPAVFHPSVAAIGWIEVGIDEPGQLTIFPVASSRQFVGFHSSGGLRVESVAN